MQRGEGSKKFLVIQRFDYGKKRERSGVVVIEMRQEELKNLYSQILGTDVGMAFLTDNTGKVLYVCDNFNGVYSSLSYETGWEEYLERNGWQGKTVITEQAFTGVNGWSVLVALPQKELFSRIWQAEAAVLVLCVFLILIGVAVCFLYWNNNQPVVEQYHDLVEKYADQPFAQRKSNNIWRNFEGVFEHVEDMHFTLDKRKQWAQEGILQRILYGSYDSEQELEKELKEAELDICIEFPCILIQLEIENPVEQDVEIDVEELEGILREELDGELPYFYYMIRTTPFNYILLLQTKDVSVQPEELKTLLETINYALYSQIPVNIFTGISGRADSIEAVAEEYEHVRRSCEYAKYYKLRVPCLWEELPAEQPVIFTVELEIQLEETVKNGTAEQLESVMSQIEENYFRRGGASANYSLEFLRCILIRLLSTLDRDIKAKFQKEICDARSFQEMKKGIEHIWMCLEECRRIDQDQVTEHLKEEIEKNMELAYADPGFNLAILAERLQVPEKKLYRDFRKIYGISFTAYLEMKRIQCAQRLLKADRPVYEVSRETGYGNDFSFRRAFKRVVGVTPSDYQKIQKQLQNAE